MSGPKKSDQDSIRAQSTALNEQAKLQRQVADQQLSFAKDDRGKRDTYVQPMIDRFMRIINGDATESMRSVAPELGNIDSQFRKSKEEIYNNLGPGASRDAALARLSTDKASGTAGYLNKAYTSAFDKLGEIGQGFGNYALQDTAAASNFLTGATNTSNSAIGATKTVMDADAQKKASTLGFIGSLAGMAGSIATGGLMGGGKGGGGGVSGNAGVSPSMYAPSASYGDSWMNSPLFGSGSATAPPTLWSGTSNIPKQTTAYPWG